MAKEAIQTGKDRAWNGTKQQQTRAAPDKGFVSQTGKHRETKGWFLERVNKIDKPLARHAKKKRGRTQINTVRNEKGESSTDTAEIQKNRKRIL